MIACRESQLSELLEAMKAATTSDKEALYSNSKPNNGIVLGKNIGKVLELNTADFRIDQEKCGDVAAWVREELGQTDGDTKSQAEIEILLQTALVRLGQNKPVENGDHTNPVVMVSAKIAPSDADDVIGGETPNPTKKQ